MQLIAMITMLIDHLGAVFFPDERWMRIVGRIAFPIYCYLLVAGYQRTRSRKRYAFRLFGLALLSQLPFMMAFSTFGINVIGTLFAALLIIMAIDYFKGNAEVQWVVGVLLIVLTYWPMEQLNFDYATYGVLLVLIFRYISNAWAMVAAHFVLNLIITFGIQYSNITQIYSVLPTLFIAGLQSAAPNAKTEIRLPRWLWRAFYPAHLTLIALINWQISGITFADFWQAIVYSLQ